MADTERKTITVATATWRYLEELAALGTHGASANDVAKSMIEEGVRQAIRDGIIAVRRAPRADD